MSEFQKPYSEQALKNFDSLNWNNDKPCGGDLTIFCDHTECQHWDCGICGHESMKDKIHFHST